MALFRKFFYRKPPDGLLEICERVYVFDCCFSTDGLEEDNYKVYMGGIVGQLRDQFPDASFMVFNFREGERQSQISSILSDYDMTVMDYPRNYEGCPLLPMEMIHHFLRSSESWLSLGQQNLLLMHCERGGWPVLAFMLAGLLIYRKQYSGEQKTLDMIYKQAPRELLQFFSPLNPLPSQLRYLQYISRRNVGSEWPPLDRALTLDCVILRMIPNFDGEGGCRPIFRIYGQDPFIASDRTPKVLFSTPKRSKIVRLYKQADCELVKIDIHCHIQGDVVLECISLDDDLEREEMMFRVMFNTAFIRSNILMLNRDEIDILWNAKDRFVKDFRAEVLLSEMDTSSSLITVDLAGEDESNEKEGLPMEAFAKVQEIFNNVDWLDANGDAALNALQQMTGANLSQGKLESVLPRLRETVVLPQETSPSALKENLKSDVSEKKAKSSFPFTLKKLTAPILKRSPDSETNKEKVQPQEVPIALKPSPDVNLTTKKVQPEKLAVALKPLPDSYLANMKVQPQEVPVALKPSPDSNLTIDKVLQQEVPVAVKLFPDDNLTKEKVQQQKVPIAPKPSPDSNLTEDKVQPPKVLTAMKPSPDSELIKEKAQLQELLVALQRPAKIISQRFPSSPLSSPVSHSSSLKGSPVSMSRYHSAPSSLGITALLHDHAAYEAAEANKSMKTPAPSPSLSTSGGPCLSEPSSHNSDSCQQPSLIGPSREVSMAPLPLLPHPIPSQLLSASKPAPSLSPLAPPQSVISSPVKGSSMSVPPPSPLPFCLGLPPSDATSLGTLTPRPSPASTLSMIASAIAPPPLPQTPPIIASSVAPSPPLSPPSPPIRHSSTSSLPLPPTLPTIASLASYSPPPPPPPRPPTLPIIASSASYSPPPPPCPPTIPAIASSASHSPSPPPPPPPPHPPTLPRIASSASNSPPPPPPPPTPPAIAPSTSHSPTPPPPLHASMVTLSASPPHPPSTPLIFSSSASPPPPPPPMKKQAVESSPPPAPPPPLRFGSSPGPTTALTPPPPPPPHFASKPHGSSISQIHPQAPSAPPPPPPGVHTPLTKQPGAPVPPSLPGGSKGAGNIGAPPPAIGIVPPPFSSSFGVKGRGARNQSTTKRTSLKPLHWVKVTRAMQGSLWAESQRNDESSKAPEFDMSELESLFSAAVPSSDEGKKADKSSRRAVGPKSDRVHLIDLRRANNCEIMLTKVKMPLPDLLSTVLALDDTVLDADQVDNLIKFCPTKEEIEMLKGYTGDKENLGRCEQFFLELMKAPRVESKLRVFSFKIQFGSQVSDLRNSLNIVNSAAEEIRMSAKLKRIMQTILSLGNALNQGTARGSAIGFRLDSLLKLADTRARNNKMTLMHYLCKVLAEKLPELLDFQKDLVSLEAATKIQLKSLAEEMQAISKGLEKVEQELTASENDGPVSETFRKTLKEFLVVAEAEVRSLTSLYSGVGRNADALAVYFGEDPARCAFEQVVSTLLNFVRMFGRAHEENCKQIELEKKKAQKEAEQEKMKVATPRKESEQLSRSPFKSSNIN